MKEHLLDSDSVTTLPDGYVLASTETAFLRLATESKPLLVQGPRLCGWAECFFRGRGFPFRYTRPLIQELRDVCPGLTEEQARKVIEQLPPYGFKSLASPLSDLNVLQQLYPIPLWRNVPSTRHVAEWLVWLYKTDPPIFIQPLLRQVGQRWRDKLNQPEQDFYQATSKVEAEQCIERWIGVDDTLQFTEPFPIEMPPPIVERVVADWQTRIIRSQGDYFSYLSRQKIPALLKEKTASGTADFYQANPAALTREKLHELSVFLHGEVLSQLYQILPPDPPAPLPSAPQDILDWFRESYLPYREWQHNYSQDLEKRKPVLDAAQQFADWYLTHFPEALVGQELEHWLSFNRVVELTKQEGMVTLVIVLDGLHAVDARELLRQIEASVPRLTLVANEFAFSPLPTVTQFCKQALFAGVPHNLVDEVPAIGQVVPDKQSPVKALAKASNGDLFLWRVEEPDATYHWRNSSDSLLREVRGKLDTVTRNIRDIVEKVPEHIMLHLAIVTDHGRLLGRSERTVPVPAGMESHGRAAWGPSPVQFEGQSFVIEDNIAYLEADSFGLTTDVAIVLDEAAFRTNDDRGGSEIYAHGGLFPEEVIIPWLTFDRDVKRPQLSLSISGTGTARKAGELQVEAINTDNRPVIVEELELWLGGSPRLLTVMREVSPQSKLTFSCALGSWPSAEEVATVEARANVTLRNKLAFTIPADIALQSEDMYRRDNILEDLL